MLIVAGNIEATHTEYRYWLHIYSFASEPSDPKWRAE